MEDWVKSDLYGQLYDIEELMSIPEHPSICHAIVEPYLLHLAKNWSMFKEPIPAKLLTAKNPENKWRLTSCMQKGIRRGDEVMALNAANALYDIDPEYGWRRLPLVALEDVGFGCLTVCAVLMAVSGKKAWRSAIDHRTLFLKCVLVLTLSPKDRLACEIRMLCKYSPYKDEMFADIMGAPVEKQMDAVTDTTMPLSFRTTAAWILAGTKRYEDLEPQTPSNHDALYEAFDQMCSNMNAVTHYLMRRHAATSYAMWLGIPFILEMMEHTKVLEGHEVDLPKVWKVGKLWGVAYDQYTREGKSAIRYFNKMSAHDLDPYLGHLGHEARISALSIGVFIYEGAALNPILMYDKAEDHRSEAIKYELLHAGIPYEDQVPFIDKIGQLLPALDKARRRILESKIASSKIG